MKHTREQKRAALLTQAQALIEEFLDWEAQAERPNLTQIEDAALDLRARFGQELAATALADQDAKQPAAAPPCPSCGAALRYKGQKALDAERRLGLLEFARGYYCARCHSGLCPPGRPAWAAGWLLECGGGPAECLAGRAGRVVPGSGGYLASGGRDQHLAGQHLAAGAGVGCAIGGSG